MTDDRDPALEQLFSAAAEELPGNGFNSTVLARTDRLKRRRIIARALLAAALALIAVPLEDVGLVMAQLLLVSLVSIDNALVAELLAPVNSVGSLLSFTLLALRAFHKRLFT